MHSSDTYHAHQTSKECSLYSDILSYNADNTTYLKPQCCMFKPHIYQEQFLSIYLPQVKVMLHELEMAAVLI